MLRQLTKSFRRSSRAVYRSAKASGILYLLTMATCTIAGRKHYTVDVALAVVIAGLTFFRFQVPLHSISSTLYTSQAGPADNLSIGGLFLSSSAQLGSARLGVLGTPEEALPNGCSKRDLKNTWYAAVIKSHTTSYHDIITDRGFLLSDNNCHKKKKQGTALQYLYDTHTCTTLSSCGKHVRPIPSPSPQLAAPPRDRQTAATATAPHASSWFPLTFPPLETNYRKRPHARTPTHTQTRTPTHTPPPLTHATPTHTRKARRILRSTRLCL